MAVMGRNLNVGRGGTGFINIAEYLRNPNFGKIAGEKIAKEMETKGSNVTNQIGSWEQGTGSEIEANTPEFDQQEANRLIESVSAKPQDIEAIKSAKGTPTIENTNFGKYSYTKAPDSIATPTINMPTVPTGGKYTGPSDVTFTKGYKDVLGSTENLANEASQLQNPYAIGEKIQGLATQPNYTRGMKALDTAFTLKEAPNEIARAQGWSGIRGYLSGKEKAVNERIGLAKQQEANVAKSWADTQDKILKTAEATKKSYFDTAQTRMNELRDLEKQAVLDRDKLSQDKVARDIEAKNVGKAEQERINAINSRKREVDSGAAEKRFQQDMTREEIDAYIHLGKVPKYWRERFKTDEYGNEIPGKSF